MAKRGPNKDGDRSELVAPSWEFSDGTIRKMGALPPKPDFGGFVRFSAANPLIPRSQWRDVDFSPFLGDVWNQGNHGSCVGHGSAKAFELAYRIAGGTLPPSGFSPTSLYALINGNRDGGAIVSDAMDALIEDGICTMAECPESVIYVRQIPKSANETRKRFRIRDAYHCATFDAIGSAIQLGFPVSFGITIRAGFNNPPASGIIPTGGYILGGHCMMVYGCVKLSNGQFGLRVRNSWGTGWGVGGNCILTEGHFPGQTDAFAVIAGIADPLDPNKAPVAP